MVLFAQAFFCLLCSLNRRSPPRNPMGNCLLFMPVVFRGATIGGVIALVIQLSGPSLLHTVISNAMQLALLSTIETPAHAIASKTSRHGIGEATHDRAKQLTTESSRRE